MNDRGRIVLGLLAFLALITFPVWYNLVSGQDSGPPEIVLPTDETRCVADREFMRTEHMQLLMDWRDEVVRDEQRIYTTEDGRRFPKSLAGTMHTEDGGSCMSCHANKDKFCDRCHDYLSVTPYCWDCHVEPKGEQ
jgi:hypothetical protein